MCKVLLFDSLQEYNLQKIIYKKYKEFKLQDILYLDIDL